MNKVYAWHFIQPSKLAKYDNRPIERQKTLTCEPDRIKLCEYGLHASIKPLDALSFVDWNDAIICRVKLSGRIIHGDHKLVASERKVLWWAPVDKTLHEFACWCAEQTLYIFERDYTNDKRPRNAIEAKKLWLAGKITENELDAAKDAAWAAAWDAARDAARDAQNKQLEVMLMALKPERRAK